MFCLFRWCLLILLGGVYFGCLVVFAGFVGVVLVDLLINGF